MQVQAAGVSNLKTKPFVLPRFGLGLYYRTAVCIFLRYVTTRRATETNIQDYSGTRVPVHMTIPGG